MGSELNEKSKLVKYDEGEDRLSVLEAQLDGKENSIIAADIDGMVVIVAKGRLRDPLQHLVRSACSMVAAAVE